MRSLEVLSYDILVVSQMVSLLILLKKFHWEEYLVQIVGSGPGKDNL